MFELFPLSGVGGVTDKRKELRQTYATNFVYKEPQGQNDKTLQHMTLKMNLILNKRCFL